MISKSRIPCILVTSFVFCLTSNSLFLFGFSNHSCFWNLDSDADNWKYHKTKSCSSNVSQMFECFFLRDLILESINSPNSLCTKLWEYVPKTLCYGHFYFSSFFLFVWGGGVQNGPWAINGCRDISKMVWCINFLKCCS